VAEGFSNLVTIGDGLVGGQRHTIRYGLINQGRAGIPSLWLPAHWKKMSNFTGPNIRRKEASPARRPPAAANRRIPTFGRSGSNRTSGQGPGGGYTACSSPTIINFDPEGGLRWAWAGAHALGVERGRPASIAITTAASLKLDPKAIADPFAASSIQTELAGHGFGAAHHAARAC